MPESQGRGPGPVLRWAVSSSRQFTTAARSSGELSSPAAGGRLQLGDRVGAVCGDQQQVGAEGGPGRLPGDTEHNLLGHHLQCPDDFASCQVFGGRWWSAMTVGVYAGSSRTVTYDAHVARGSA